MRLMCLVVAAGLLPAPAFAADVTVKVTGIKPKGGVVKVALYARDPLYRDPVASAEQASGSTTDLQVTIPNVAPGEYVITAWHDADKDGRLGLADGRMTEGTAISNAKKLRGAPTFAVNKVPVAANGATVTIAMSYPEDRSGW